jgi:hypothetical protein
VREGENTCVGKIYLLTNQKILDSKFQERLMDFPPPLPETGEVNLLSEVVSFPSDNFIRVSLSYSVQQLKMF